MESAPKNKTETYASESLQHSIAMLNIRRMPVIFLLAVLFAGMNLFFYFSLSISSYGIFEIIFPAICSIVYLAVYFWKIRGRVVKINHISAFCVSYWIVLTVSMFPFFVSEITKDGNLPIPLNLLIFFAALAIVPAFSLRELLALFPFIIAYFSGIFIAYRADIYYIITFAVFSLTSFLISYRTYKTYLETIGRFQAMSDLDPLTALFNKVTGFEKLRDLVGLCGRHERLCAVYMLDLDDFKKFNDSYGHVSGDSALVAVARALRSIFERQTDVVYRMGGEEFTVCISVSSREHALRLAKNLLAAVDAISIDNSQADSACPRLSISIGLVVISPGGETPYEALAAVRAADRQLYIAKNSGKRAIAFENEIVSP